MVHPPLLLEKKQRREKPALQLAGGGEGAERREGAPHVGARAGRRARGGGGGSRGSLSARKEKKKQKFSPDFPAAAPRFGARAGFPAREAARIFGGAWKPRRVPGPRLSRFCWGFARRWSTVCSLILSRWWWRESPQASGTPDPGWLYFLGLCVPICPMGMQRWPLWIAVSPK